MSTPSPLDPEDQALYDIRTLFIRACADEKFRTALIDNPTEAAKQMNIYLRPVDDKHVRDVSDLLQRFAKNPALHPDDVASWATGVLLRSVTCQLGMERWGVGILSIQRFAFACADPKSESPLGAPAPERSRP